VILQGPAILKTAEVALVAFAVAITAAGCEVADNPGDPNSPQLIRQHRMNPVVCAFSPARIRIIGLTEIVGVGDSSDTAAISIYLDVFDAYDSHIKAPARFRFELFEFVPRSSEPRGDRLVIWPDIDLTEPAANNSYWQDYLRAYHFQLGMDFKPAPGATFTLEATCTTPDGRRLSDKRRIRYTP